MSKLQAGLDTGSGRAAHISRFVHLKGVLYRTRPNGFPIASPACPSTPLQPTLHKSIRGASQCHSS
jgi:hypothetical protein